ncbi:phosphoribosyltransferase-like protein [Lactarius quietus]|nr:phosphoribosyltransferase-like protein [Lactarius quietus]
MLLLPAPSCTVTKFSNGEVNVNITESVRNENLFILQSATGTRMMELLILVSACEGASARRMTADISESCHPYACMDKETRAPAPLTAILVANMRTVAAYDHAVTHLSASVDLHASQIQGFFDLPVDNFYSEPLMISYQKAGSPLIRIQVVQSGLCLFCFHSLFQAHVSLYSKLNSWCFHHSVTVIAAKLGLEFALFYRKRDGKTQDGWNS